MNTYTSFVVDYSPKKPNPNKVRIKVDGNLIEYLQKVTTQLEDNIAAKMVWNSAEKTLYTKYFCADMKRFT